MATTWTTATGAVETDLAPDDIGATTDVATLLAHASMGFNGAWNELVRRYEKLIAVIARNHRLNEADAAEVAQVTWMKLVENIDRIEQPERVNAWIATTARRECLRILRASGRMRPMPTEDLVPLGWQATDSPEEGPLAEERDVALRLAYDRLPARCRMLLALLTGDAAVSYKKLSTLMDIKIGSIGPTRGRCLERLRQLAIEHGVQPG